MNSKKRCEWAEKHELEAKYHDAEWGVPVTDDNLHFELITLEGAQAGLSWLTILIKRDNYRKLFYGFDPKKVAKLTSEDMELLRQNEGIVRHRQKIASTVNNAKCFLEIQKEYGSFNQYIWSFVNYSPIDNAWRDSGEVPASTPLSDAISKDLKKKGFKFVGTTTMYAYIQSIGMVNDHVTSCFKYQDTLKAQEQLRQSFKGQTQSKVNLSAIK